MNHLHQAHHRGTSAHPRRAASVAGASVSLGLLAFGCACTDHAIIMGLSGAGSVESAPEPGAESSAPESSAPPIESASVAVSSGSREVDGPPTPVRGAAGESSSGVESAGLTDGSPPVLRNAVGLSDDDLARQALAVLGSAAVGAEGSCQNCHSLGRPTLTRWQRLTDEFSAACLGQPVLNDVVAVDAMLSCFQTQAGPSPAFSPQTFGVYAAAARLPWFSSIFARASLPAGSAQARHDDFVQRVGMPRAGTPLTQAQFDLVAEWFARGLPRLFELVPEDSGEDCTAGLDPRLRSHITEMAHSGWKARNEQVPLLMFGCQSGQAAAECLGQVPFARDESFGAGWDIPGGARIRILHDNTEAPSNYWSRSSADGRFIASGLRATGSTGYDGQIVDLQRGRVIDGDFGFDPTFFPDNSGFMVQRAGYSASSGPTDGSANASDTAVVCNQSVLSGDPDLVPAEEGDCTELTGQIGLYQQLAKSVDGDDHWVVYGSFDEDNGGFRATLDNPSAAFTSESQTTLTPMINQGTAFVPGAPTHLRTPLQGDPMLSPSGRLLITRLKGREYTVDVGGSVLVKAEQSGYALHLVTTSGDGARVTASVADLGRVCLQGGKAVISYDERWMVLHHYVTASDATELGFSGPDDPAFADYLELGASNLILVDLLDGSSSVITHMGAGQYALFPHFRSDGWLYFVVRTLDGNEWFAATDAAVLRAAPL